jgi:hypothetical protein
MKASLSPSWELTTDHAASRYGQPVLVRRSTGEAYGPEDILQAYASWGSLPAARVVARLAKTVHLDDEGQAMVALFVVSLPPR